MRLDNEFTVGVPIEQAWSVLTDLELIAPCMPGAQLTGVNDGVYTGKVKIKVGPVTAEYSGTAQFTEKDDAAYSAVIDARGRDSRGQGNANAVISARLRSAGSSTVVSVGTDLTIAGRIAQFGSGMIAEISAKLLGQFVDCLEGKLGAGQAEPAAASAAAVAPAPAGHEAGPAASAQPAASAEPAALNLMSLAGGAVYKRLVPAVVGVIVIAVIVYLIAR
jgi:carbon monoxide dehydrogenase subunit G